MKMKKKFSITVYHIGMIIGSFIMLYPLFWLLGSSLKTNEEYYASIYSLIPKSWAFSNYIEGWAGFARLTFATFFKNSIFNLGFIAGNEFKIVLPKAPKTEELGFSFSIKYLANRSRESNT